LTVVNNALIAVLGTMLALNTPIDRTSVIALGVAAAIGGVIGLALCAFDYMKPNRQV
jgi:hypothetical protein